MRVAFVPAWKNQIDLGLPDNLFDRFRTKKEGMEMTHVVTQPCVGCRYTDCVVVCPVECFYEGEKMLYIHPDECIDCEACVAECPVEAIFHEDNVPSEWQSYIAMNAEQAPQSKVITEKKKPLVDS
jgi:ferredoxin